MLKKLGFAVHKEKHLTVRSAHILGCLGLLAAVLIQIVTVRGTANAQDNSACDLQNAVLIGTSVHGINCLDNAGWHELALQTSGITVSSIEDIAICPDTNHILLANTFGLMRYDGSSWTDFAVPDDVVVPAAVACTPGGQVWVAHTSGLSHFNGSDWTLFEDDLLGSGEYIFGVNDVAVSSDGTVWAVTTSSIARYNGTEWEVFEENQGLDGFYALSKVEMNSEGMPVVAHSSGLLRYDGQSWSSEQSPLLFVESMMIDNQDRIWLGSFDEGVVVLEAGEWRSYNMESGLSSNYIHTLAQDAAGRIWVGTEWGLNVLDGETWSVYEMANSDLLDNRIDFIGMLGDGLSATLPAVAEKAPGSVVGLIELGQASVADADVELCAGTVSGIFYGDSPCADIPGSFYTKTNANGEFSFQDVPVGRYNLSINGPDGWVYFIDPGSAVVIVPGQEVDLADIEIGE